MDGCKIKIRKVIELEVEYKGIKLREKFNIIESPKCKRVLLGNGIVKTLENKHFMVGKKEVPVLCRINTETISPFSWTTSIRSFKDRADFKRLIEDLESRGIVEPSQSTWLNSVVLCRKKNGSLRFCVDFRKLNAAVELDEFELPRLQESNWQPKNCRHFTSFDLKMNFIIKIVEQDKEKTTFSTKEKLYQFTRMPQGFKNSPSIL